MGILYLTSEIERPSSIDTHQSSRVFRKLCYPANVTMNKVLIALFVIMAFSASVQGDAGYGRYYKRDADAAAGHRYYKRDADADAGYRGYAGYYKRDADATAGYPYYSHYAGYYKRDAEAAAGGYRGYYGYPYRGY